MQHKISVDNLLTKLKYWEGSQNQSIHYKGVHFDQWILLHFEFIQERLKNSSLIILMPGDEEVDQAHSFLSKFFPTEIFPGLDESPYSSLYQSESALHQRFKVLNSLSSNAKFITLCTADSFILKNPPLDFFRTSKLTLEVEDIISPDDLSKSLISLGYVSSPTVEEPGTYSKRGEIFDIYSDSYGPLRLHYFDELIEHIFRIDLNTQKTIKDNSLQKIELEVAPQILVNEKYKLSLRNNLPQFGPAQKDLFEQRKEIFTILSKGNLFENYCTFIPLFFDEPQSLAGLVNELDFDLIVYDENNITDAHEEHMHNIFTTYEEEVKNSNTILPEPDFFYNLKFEEILSETKHVKISPLDISINLDEDLNTSISLNLIDFNIFLQKEIKDITLLNNQYSKVKTIIQFINSLIKKKYVIHFFVKSDSSKNEIKHLLELNSDSTTHYQNIIFKIGHLSKGFSYVNENIFYLTESDLFTVKTQKTKKTKRANTDLFADQLSTLAIGDFLVHKDHGIGLYQGLETLELSGQSSDFVVIKYADDDKVYVPVYKLDLIQKFADASAGQKVANLRSKKFNTLKNKVKSSIKKLAFDLLKLQAKRQTNKGFKFSEPDELFTEFEKTFPFQETPDQLHTIEEVIGDMTSDTSMDRLVCGDVGFGKTEIAMRASFKAVLDKKQVAILVPTTVLAYQHYNSFVERFKQFPVNIEFLSRFKSKKQSDEILEQLENGKVDIVIGTHKLLSPKIKYQDLGLVIVDEEHRFGVAHKEKLKVLKINVDFLTLTATPIPRTLQLSFLGLRDLSIIKTAPPKRKSIKSYVIKEDKITIKNAIEKELARGGQIFIVHNRVHDIDEYAAKIRDLVPSAEICVAHGQMSERILESKIKAFYSGHYNILLSTTIIESGIDIPNANTMIIDRANTFGLAQLHQLRGRIGRSDKKAYAYFIIPNEKKLTDTASKRLQALKKYADIGSGFSLASSDLEIRGAGDILGAEQSGHIENIGLELYMQLLKEAIQDIKGEVVDNFSNIEIHSNFACFIPKKFIENSAHRLRFYKRLSNANSAEKLNEIYNELQDIYGLIPTQVDNLVLTLKSRVNFSKIGIKTVKVTGTQIKLNFDKDVINSKDLLRNNMLKLFMSSKKKYQIKPDYSVICFFKEKVDLNHLFNFSHEVYKELVAS
jgi:transcription-repair coupling factor (superfamily II helicase)